MKKECRTPPHLGSTVLVSTVMAWSAAMPGGDPRFEEFPDGDAEVLGLFFDDFPDVEDLEEILGWLRTERRKGIQREEVNDAALTLDHEREVATFEDLLYAGEDVVMPFAALEDLCRRWIAKGGFPDSDAIDGTGWPG